MGTCRIWKSALSIVKGRGRVTEVIGVTILRVHRNFGFQMCEPKSISMVDFVER
ncbi:hypothetical protein CEV33_4026 [Brucella grignonensis]|uniref:Uncharacterized protein n=1 Tax=Brucella grignonensis TaxID=94627 RepID=A0A256FR35_9HYPH|nr:hypothetical protein CEV33_4026 [Brucella grignonensis]